MPVPWLRVLNAVLGVGEIARIVKGRTAPKEAFDSDHPRLEVEHVEAERLRAERLLRAELARHAGDQEISRLRLLAALATASWLASLFFSARVVGGAPAGRIALALGWLLLLSALAASFLAQAAVTRGLSRLDAREVASPGPAGVLAPWLLVAGLAVIGFAILLA